MKVFIEGAFAQNKSETEIIIYVLSRIGTDSILIKWCPEPDAEAIRGCDTPILPNLRPWSGKLKGKQDWGLAKYMFFEV